MIAGLIGIFRGMANRETTADPISANGIRIYKPAKTLINLGYAAFSIAFMALIYAVTKFNTADFMALIFISLTFAFLGLLMLSVCKRITIYRNGDMLIQKDLFQRKFHLDLKDLERIVENKRKDEFVFYTSNLSMKVSGYLIGTPRLIQEMIDAKHIRIESRD